jgi:hypothetical protein
MRGNYNITSILRVIISPDILFTSWGNSLAANPLKLFL